MVLGAVSDKLGERTMRVRERGQAEREKELRVCREMQMNLYR